MTLRVLHLLDSDKANQYSRPHTHWSGERQQHGSKSTMLVVMTTTVMRQLGNIALRQSSRSLLTPFRICQKSIFLCRNSARRQRAMPLMPHRPLLRYHLGNVCTSTLCGNHPPSLAIFQLFDVNEESTCTASARCF